MTAIPAPVPTLEVLCPTSRLDAAPDDAAAHAGRSQRQASERATDRCPTETRAALTLFPDLDGHWFSVSDADPRAVALYSRHYSVKNKRPQWRSGIGGPGERIVLLTLDCQALFLWRTRPEGLVKGHQDYDDGQRGVMCSVFRNEGPIRSSDLIREAVDIAWRRWPGARLFTYVEDAKVATSEQRGRATAGWCFRKAGWRVCGRNADRRLTILEIVPTPRSGSVESRCTDKDRQRL